MGYLHIPNLYSDRRILAFKRVYALEKVHGTSTHLHFANNELGYFAGGVSETNFRALFDHEKLTDAFRSLREPEIWVFGEAYGGSCMKMSHLYGPQLRFVAFDVKIGDLWLGLEDAYSVVIGLNLPFVPWVSVSTDPDALDAERDTPSAIAADLGIVGPREGVVLRPPFECTLNNGERLIAKHKAKAFEERANPPKIQDPEREKTNLDAKAFAEEWCVPMRLEHVIDHWRRVTVGAIPPRIEDTFRLANLVADDIARESGRTLDRAYRTAITKRAAILFRDWLELQIHEDTTCAECGARMLVNGDLRWCSARCGQ